MSEADLKRELLAWIDSFLARSWALDLTPLHCRVLIAIRGELASNKTVLTSIATRLRLRS